MKPLIVLFGSTGNSGVHIANRLLDQGYPTRIVVRNRNKVSKIYQERQIAFQNIIESELHSIEGIEKALQPSKVYGKVRYVISALGATERSSVEKIQFDVQKKIIDTSKKYEVDKYFLLSAAHTDNAWHPITFLLNMMLPDIMYQKSRAQNYLRLSGLSYGIFRPPHLVGNAQDCTITPYTISQGSLAQSQITRFTLAKLIVDSLQDDQFPEKVTIECSGSKQQGQLTFKQLAPDTIQKLITTSHRLAKYTYLGIILSIIGFMIYKFTGGSGDL